MNNNLLELSQLRNNIKFASISQFFHTFQSAFRPWPDLTQDLGYARPMNPNDYVFETEDLERMILDSSEKSHFEDLLVKMLRLASSNRFINSSNWQIYFSKEFDKRQQDEPNPFVDQPNYFALSLDTKLHLLLILCEWQLDDPEKFREHLDSEQDAVQWRVDPIGFDKKGSTFWLFDDNRLYKETPKPVKKPTKKSIRKSSRRSVKQEESEEEEEEEEEWVPWKLICCTKYEWEQFPTKYKDSKNMDEQRFYDLLINDLLPKVLPVLEEHEKELKKQEAMLHRKRSSRIMIKELEALERASVEPLDDFEYYQRSGRSSSRLEQKQQEKQQKEKENQAKAREERLLEREKRIMEREYRALAREKKQEVKPVVIDEPPPKITLKLNSEEKPAKRKYTKRPKFDEFGNPIPKKLKLDADGNPIPLKKRGRKPKNKEEDNWMFDCICGVAGKNLDDGSPMIACEKCGIWQHIACLQKSGIVEKDKSLDNLVFICQRCDNQVNEQDNQPPPTFGYYNGASETVQLPPIQSTWSPSVRDTAQPAIETIHQSDTNIIAPTIPNSFSFSHQSDLRGSSYRTEQPNRTEVNNLEPKSMLPIPESSIRTEISLNNHQTTSNLTQ